MRFLSHLSLLALSSSLLAADPMVVNGDFEQIAAGKATGWSSAKWGKGITLEQVAGNHFVRFAQDTAKDYVLVEQTVAVPANWAKVKISARLAASALQLGDDPSWKDFRLMIEFRGADGKRIGDYGYVPRLTVAGAWQTLSAERDVPVGTVSLVLSPGLYFASGEADLDDVHLEVVSTR